MPTNSFIDTAMQSLDNTDARYGAKPAIKLFGATSGSTKQINITSMQLHAINTVLRLDDTGDEASQAQRETLGRAMVSLLNLPVDKEGKVATSNGPKTLVGLGDCLFTLMAQNQH